MNNHSSLSKANIRLGGLSVSAREHYAEKNISEQGVRGLGVVRKDKAGKFLEKNHRLVAASISSIDTCCIAQNLTALFRKSALALLPTKKDFSS